MSERSVAEIIGWQRVGYTAADGVAQCWVKPLAGDYEPAPPYTVDELLAWLTDREGYVEIGGYVGGAVVYSGRGNCEADTLLAALEAAVRAVAGES